MSQILLMFSKILPKNDNSLLKNNKSVPNWNGISGYQPLSQPPLISPKRLNLKKERTMNPQVRETEQTTIAVPSTQPMTAPVNALKIAKPVIEIKAPAPEEKEERGISMLDKRRRRRARLSNRH